MPEKNKQLETVESVQWVERKNYGCQNLWKRQVLSLEWNDEEWWVVTGVITFVSLTANNKFT